MKQSGQVNLFESATLRLTAWYVVLIMLLSFVFSVVLYSVASIEVERALTPRRQGFERIFIENDQLAAIRAEMIADGNARIVASLVLFNLAVLLSGTAISYMLARRTLRPIEEAHIAQARFASDAAHELRTPLAVMQTEAEVVLRDPKAQKAQYRETLESTLEEVGRMRTLTERLLALAAQQRLESELVNTEEVAVEVLNRMLPLAQNKQVRIANTVSADFVEANRDALTNILEIFTENAVKYSPRGTVVTLLSKVSGRGMVRLSVRDQGPGIPFEEQEKIFDRFYRVDPSRSKEYVEGHGLGLSLAKRLGEEMNAALGVVSVPGEGAEFYVEVPLSKR